MSKYFRFCCCITQKKIEILQKTIDISAILPYIVELSRHMHFCTLIFTHLWRERNLKDRSSLIFGCGMTLCSGAVGKFAVTQGKRMVVGDRFTTCVGTFVLNKGGCLNGKYC